MFLFRSRFGSLLLGLCGLGCVADTPDKAPGGAIAEFSEDTLALKAEVVVARDIMQAYAKYGVLVDSVFAVAEAAPGYPSAEARPSARTVALRDSLGASAGMKPSNSVLRLSKPRIAGGVARVTVTVDFPSASEPGGKGYETVDYTLERTGTSWTVRTRVQLGIT